MSNSHKNSDKTTANHCRQSLHNCLHVRSLFNCSVCIVLHTKEKSLNSFGTQSCTSRSYNGPTHWIIVLRLVIWHFFKSNRHEFQIESQSNRVTFKSNLLLLKSNLHKWFNHDLNRIAIWICPSLIPAVTDRRTDRHVAVAKTPLNTSRG